MRFANTDVWNDSTGGNVLTQQLSIDPTAIGSVDPDTAELVELPYDRRLDPRQIARETVAKQACTAL